MAILGTSICGVQLVKPMRHEDTRGEFCEAFRASWFSGGRQWVQWNVSRSKAGVLRGMHFHRLQTDYWWLADGSIRVGLVDLRPESLTVRQATCLELDSDDPMGLIIPPGVLHGYRALRDAVVMYLMDQEYSGADEYGVRWDDPALGLPDDWRAGPPPVLSPRDAAAPTLGEVLGQHGRSAH